LAVRIDVHNHAIPQPALELLAREPGYGVELEGRRWRGGMHVDFQVADAFVDPHAKLAELETCGLAAAVVSVAPPLFYYHVEPAPGERMARVVNRGLAEMCAAVPERLRWLATLPMQAPERARRVLDEAVADGCVGVEIGSSIAGRRLDEVEFEPFWEAVERHGLPVTIHPAYTEGVNPALAPYYLENVLGYLFDTTIAIERLICAGTLARHPALRLVLLHGGGYFPYQAGRLRHAGGVRPELVDASADPWAHLDQLRFDPITHDAGALRFLIERVGAQRVVMGTDLPFDMGLREPIAMLRAAADERTAAAIAEQNPAALYGWKSSVVAGPEAGDRR
jgi:aminocarboxymuconate-semialdehyde decarboxylase